MQKTKNTLKDERRQKGLCTLCGEPNDRIPKVHCSVCAQKRSDYQKQWRLNKLASNLCPRCGNTLDRKGFYCADCLNIINKNTVTLKQKRKDNNLCVSCGGPELMTKTLCKDCYQREMKNLEKRTKELEAKGLCTVCGKEPIKQGTKWCVSCSQKDVEKKKNKISKKLTLKEVL